MPSNRHQPTDRRILSFLLIVALVLLRVVWLDSDAYARLSWSSALLTDEGFYIHNARNLVLFGHARTDDFNNALIMPLLHFLQVAVFRMFGVGALQARSISIVTSLLTLLVFFCALRRAFSPRVAWLSLLLLGFDPVFTLYNRLALMDTPACLPLVCAFYAWGRAEEEKKRRKEEEKKRREGQREIVQTSVQRTPVPPQPHQQTSAPSFSHFPVFSSSLLLFFSSSLSWLFVCGACLGLAYTVRGLAAVVLPVPFLLLLLPAFRQGRQRRRVGQELPPGALAAGIENTRQESASVLRTREAVIKLRKNYVRVFSQQALASAGRLHFPAGWVVEIEYPDITNVLALLAGLTLVLGVYLIGWYLPHHQEIARVNAYYLHHQLLPHNIHQLWQNAQHAFFGDDRGLSPYLFRHTPVTFSLCLLWLLTEKGAEGKGKREKEKEGTDSPFFSSSLLPSAFLALWLLLTWAMLAVISYAPDRYYILFYPAMCGLAALALSDLEERLARLWASRWKRALLGGFLAYHLGEAFLHHQSLFTEICLYAFTFGTLVMLALLPPNVSQWRERLHLPTQRLTAFVLFLWALVALGWTGDWLSHIAYTQRDAGVWLATHLPADSVLIGDVAPGLCMNNRFRVVNVIPGLCNDVQPVERYAPAPRYIVILDGKFKEPWWRKNYPALVAPDHRTHLFPRLIRLPVGVYAVGTEKAKR